MRGNGLLDIMLLKLSGQFSGNGIITEEEYEKRIKQREKISKASFLRKNVGDSPTEDVEPLLVFNI